MDTSIVRFRAAVRYILLWALYILIGYIVYRIRVPLLTVSLPFVLALLLAYVLTPLVKFIEARRVPRTLAILIVYLALASIVFLAGSYAIPRFYTETRNLVTQLPNYLTQVQAYIRNLQASFNTVDPTGLLNVPSSSIQKLEALLGGLVSGTVDVVVGFVSGLVLVVIVPVLAFYFIRDAESLHDGILSMIPRKYRRVVVDVTDQINSTLGLWVRGQVLVMMVVAVEIWIGLSIVGMDYTVTLAIIAGLLDVIPYFGPFFGALPAVLLAFLRSPLMGFKVALVYFVAQQIESLFITPQIMGHSLDLHPLVIVLAILLGGKLFGFWGILFAVPGAAVLRVILRQIADRDPDLTS
jgi:predicted PurR-regulated permease PerM